MGKRRKTKFQVYNTDFLAKKIFDETRYITRVRDLFFNNAVHFLYLVLWAFWDILFIFELPTPMRGLLLAVPFAGIFGYWNMLEETTRKPNSPICWTAWQVSAVCEYFMALALVALFARLRNLLPIIIVLMFLFFETRNRMRWLGDD